MVCERDETRKLDQNFVKIRGSCDYGFGESCNYECVQGYITGGVTASACQDDGKMHPPPPRCTRKYLSLTILVTFY